MIAEEHKIPADQQIQSRVDELMRMNDEGASLEEMVSKALEDLK